MPIVDIELVADGGAMRDGLAQALADAIGQVFRSPPGQTWVRMRTLARDRYAENDAPLTATELPTFVTILKRQVPGGADLQAEMAALTASVARVTGRSPERVHVEYAVAAAGRVAFGGRLVQ